MSSRMFDELLDSGGTKGRKRGKVLPVSIGMHGLALVAVLILPLYMEDLPDPAEDQVVRAFFVESAPPPPPPPPPPAAPKQQASMPKIEKPKIEPVKVEQPQEPKFVAPVEEPQPVQQVDPGPVQMAAADVGLPDGVVGGVPEGVTGGQEGGVVGGEVGGVEGGEVGGTQGGTVGGTPGGEVGGTGTGAGDGAGEPAPPPGPVRVGGQIKPPSKVRDAAPVYPPVAREARVAGVVILEATIGADGRVDKVRVLRGVPLLNDAAVDAVRKWVYSPTLLNGTPVPVIMTVTVNFKLDQ